MKYRREIDGLRAIAVLPVILFHAGFSLFSGGFVGVDIFFVISGFLITSIIINEKRNETFSLRSFYQRRIRRILPALFFVIAVTLPFAWCWMLPSELRDFSKSLISIPLFVSNFYFQRDTGYFAAAAEEKPLLHTWSLAVEEQYYFFFPALVCLLWAGRRTILVPVLMVCAGASCWYAVSDAQPDFEKLFFDTRGRVWEILFGSLAAFYAEGRYRRELSLGTRQILSGFGLLLLLGAIVCFDEKIHFPSAYTLLPVVGTTLVLLTATSETVVGRFLGAKILVGVGLVSYSAYLWHQPLLAFARLKSPVELTSAPLLALCAFAFVLAYISWRFVERPFRIGSNFSTRFIVSGMAMASGAILSLGFFGEVNKGFQARFKGEYASVKRQIKEESRRRMEFLLPGQCHYTGKHGQKNVDEFLKNWDCASDPTRPELVKVPVVVVGDSHAADIVMSLKTNGYTPLPMSGAGCSVTPSYMVPKCKKQFDLVKKTIRDDPFYTTIFLANRFTPNEMTEKSLLAMVEYWSMPGKKLVLIGGVPEYAHYERALAMQRSPQADFSRAELTTRPKTLELLKAHGVRVIESTAAFCSTAESCSAHDSEGRPLTVDGHHVSTRGAKIFGRYLIEQGLFSLPEVSLSERASLKLP